MKKTHRRRSPEDTNPDKSIDKSQRCYNRIQQYDNSQHGYLQNLTDDNSDNDEQIFLRQYKEEFLEKELEPEDTLQTLSIQFNCPIAELKRINNIHRDNEVFARRIIKVPVKYFSLLTSNVGVHKGPATTLNGANRLGSLSPSAEVNPSTSFSQPSVAISLLNSSIHHDSVVDLLSKEGSFTITDPKLIDGIEDDEVNRRLLPADIEVTETKTPTEVFQCSGSDWGLSWLQLLSFTLLLVLGGPIIYILYHAKGLSHHLIHHNTTSTNP